MATTIKNPEDITGIYTVVSNNGTVYGSFNSYEEATKFLKWLDNTIVSYEDGSYEATIAVDTAKLSHNERESLWNARDNQYDTGDDMVTFKNQVSEYLTYYGMFETADTLFVTTGNVLSALELAELYYEDGNWYFWYGEE